MDMFHIMIRDCMGKCPIHGLQCIISIRNLFQHYTKFWFVFCWLQYKPVGLYQQTCNTSNAPFFHNIHFSFKIYLEAKVNLLQDLLLHLANSSFVVKFHNVMAKHENGQNRTNVNDCHVTSGILSDDTEKRQTRQLLIHMCRVVSSAVVEIKRNDGTSNW